MATVKPALNGKALQTGVSAGNTSGVDTGLVFERYFTDGKVSPFDNVEWEKRTALIGNEKGVTIFRQEDVEVPENGRRPPPTSSPANISTASRVAASAKPPSPADRSRSQHHRPLGR